MSLKRWWSRAEALAGKPSGATLAVEPSEWLSVATDAAAAGGQLVALWTTLYPGAAPAAAVRAALLVEGGLMVVELPLTGPAPTYRGLQDVFPAAARMQRAAADLTGVRADAPDQRPWLRHGGWTAAEAPLAAVPSTPSAAAPPVDDYAFVRVEGDGVHEVPVGPVHAGIIEPGHFRFSIVGEKVLRLEERLGYVHKGIERRFTELPILEGHRLAARVSGDSAVAYSWAYCQALEGLARAAVPPRALWLRALCLELERIQNHLGDLGALGNDAGFAFGLAQFSRLKEELTRTMATTLGQRYLLDAIVPGGIAVDLPDEAARELALRLGRTASLVRELRTIYDDHAGVRDRFAGAGTVAPELARRLGLTGLAGRASGLGFDLRVDAPWPPYHVMTPKLCMRRDGDVAARVNVRFDEIEESCRIARALVSELPAGALRLPLLEVPTGPRPAVGVIEGWRGPVLVALESREPGRIHRCHPHDPSWQNWPVIEHAVIGNIVPDFPLINKSFNLSYSGHDL
jgi:Ni,Fe-hydrogenase III large subunit